MAHLVVRDERNAVEAVDPGNLIDTLKTFGRAQVGIGNDTNTPNKLSLFKGCLYPIEQHQLMRLGEPFGVTVATRHKGESDT